MLVANQVNSTFYALRLLSHGLDVSQIQVTDGEQYPGSEFTKEEQEEALKLIRTIVDSESDSLNQVSPDKIEFYLTALADRIEDLANYELAIAGYAVETTAIGQDTTLRPPYLRMFSELSHVERVKEAIKKGARTEEDVSQETRLGHNDIRDALFNLIFLTREIQTTISNNVRIYTIIEPVGSSWTSQIAPVKGLSLIKLLTRLEKREGSSVNKLKPKLRPPRGNLDQKDT
jgi:hypothetical protein